MSFNVAFVATLHFQSSVCTTTQGISQNIKTDDIFSKLEN